jgi:hypothetical protein
MSFLHSQSILSDCIAPDSSYFCSQYFVTLHLTLGLLDILTVQSLRVATLSAGRSFRALGFLCLPAQVTPFQASLCFCNVCVSFHSVKVEPIRFVASSSCTVNFQHCSGLLCCLHCTGFYLLAWSTLLPLSHTLSLKWSGMHCIITGFQLHFWIWKLFWSISIILDSFDNINLLR